MNYVLYNDFSQIQAQEWNELLKESISDTPFLRYEYQQLWWQHRGGGEWKNAQLVLVITSVDPPRKVVAENASFISDILIHNEDTITKGQTLPAFKW